MSLDAQGLREIFREELEARSRLDAQEHADHHAFIAILIKRAERRDQMWDRVRQQVIGWATIAALGAVGAAVGGAVLRLVSKSNGGG